MVRVEFSAVTAASPDLTWKLFTNIYLWRRLTDAYGDIEWSSGAPWQTGSRLKIEVLRPVKTFVDHVITACAPPRLIAWIDHALGNTMEQWVEFSALTDGGTHVHTWAELTGPTLTVSERPVETVLREFISGWYERFCEECDLAAEQELQLP